MAVLNNSVSSTLPNLVLLKLFNELGIKKTQLGDYAEISEKAQTNAQIGMKKSYWKIN